MRTINSQNICNSIFVAFADISSNMCGRGLLSLFISLLEYCYRVVGLIRDVSRAMMLQKLEYFAVALSVSMDAEKIFVWCGLLFCLCFGVCLVGGMLFLVVFGFGLAHFQCCQKALSMLLKVTFTIMLLH